jgi:hypothetical protein
MSGNPAKPEAENVSSPTLGSCFHHHEVPSEGVCAACGEAFCSACLVLFQEQTLCGPCKDARVRSLQQTIRLSRWAFLASAVGLIGVPIGFFVPFWGAFFFLSGQATGEVVRVAIALGLALPLLSLFLGWRALRILATRPNQYGRSLAFTGVAGGVAGIVWGIALGVLLALKG